MGNSNSGSASGNKTLLIAFLVLAVLGIGVFAYKSLSTSEEAVPAQAVQVLEDQNAAPSQNAVIETAPTDQPAANGETGSAPSGGTESGEAAAPTKTGD